MYCATNQFTKLKFLGTHRKPHGVHRLGKHYHMRLDPKIGYRTYEIPQIPCASTLCTSILDQPCITSFTAQKKPRYQPDQYFTYWPVLFPFNSWNILKLSHKETPIEEIDKIHQVVLDGINDNMAALAQTDKYRTINITDTTTMGYYVIKYILEP